jgi:hypothetical protein
MEVVIMAKWADFGISAVSYNEEETHIEKVIVHEVNDESIGPGAVKTRGLVVGEIKHGKTYTTILKTGEGKWKRGQDVHTIKVKNKEYIRTDANKTGKDNLENLPEF